MVPGKPLPSSRVPGISHCPVPFTFSLLFLLLWQLICAYGNSMGDHAIDYSPETLLPCKFLFCVFKYTGFLMTAMYLLFWPPFHTKTYSHTRSIIAFITGRVHWLFKYAAGKEKIFLKTTINCTSGLFLIQRLRKAKENHLGYFSLPCLMDSDLPRV